MAVPTYDKLFNPVIKALQDLGGSGSVSEIEEKVIEILGLTEKETAEIHLRRPAFFGHHTLND